jgi:outer membrane protein
MEKILKTALSITFSASVVLFAEVASADSLRDAWAKAYLNNPMLAAERARLRSVDEGVAQARSNLRPTVAATLRSGLQYIEQDLKTGGNVSDTLMPSSIIGEVSQPIYRGGRTEADISRASSEVQAGRASLATVEQRVFLDVGTAFMDVLRDQAVLDLNNNNVKVLERQLEATKDRFSVGEVTRTDVAQAEARLARAGAERQRALGDLEVSRAAFTRHVGEPPLILTSPSPMSGIPESLQAALEIATKKNPGVLKAMNSHDAASHSVDLVTGELSPTVSLNGEVEQSFESSRTVDATSGARAIFKVTVPLYQSGSVSSRVRAAKQVKSQKLLQIEEARRQSVEEATKGWEQLVSTRSRINSLQTEIRANEIALEGVQQEALVGTRTVLDILDAEQDLLDAKVNLVRASRDEFVATLTLQAAVGGLTAGALALNVTSYDPVQHYNSVQNKAFGTD